MFWLASFYLQSWVDGISGQALNSTHQVSNKQITILFLSGHINMTYEEITNKFIGGSAHWG